MQHADKERGDKAITVPHTFHNQGLAPWAFSACSKTSTEPSEAIPRLESQHQGHNMLQG